MARSPRGSPHRLPLLCARGRRHPRGARHCRRSGGHRALSHVGAPGGVQPLCSRTGLNPIPLMIPIKDREAIARMRESCAIAATVLHRLRALVQPGISTFDLDQAGRELIASYGARSADFGYQIGSRRFPAYTCLSVNEEVVHGIGSLKRILREGDIISLDVTVEANGYIGDNAITVPVGPIDPKVARLLQTTEEALQAGIRQAQVGNRIGDI